MFLYYTFLNFRPESRSILDQQKHRDCNTKKVQLKSASLYQQSRFASPFASTKSDTKEKGNEIHEIISSTQ